MKNTAIKFKSIHDYILNANAILVSCLIKSRTELEKLQERATYMIWNNN